MRVKFIRWDWREQCDMCELERALSDVFDEKNVSLSRPKNIDRGHGGLDKYPPTYVRVVPEDVVGSDEYWAVVANERIDDEKASEIYRRYHEMRFDQSGKRPDPQEEAVDYPFT